MTGPETIKINGVTVRTNEVASTVKREKETLVWFKNGVKATIPVGQQNPYAALYSNHDWGKEELTIGYYLNGVKIEGNPNKEDHIHLTDPVSCQVNTTEPSYAEAKKDNIYIEYKKIDKRTNAITTSQEDSLTVRKQTVLNETTHKGQLNGLY